MILPFEGQGAVKTVTKPSSPKNQASSTNQEGVKKNNVINYNTVVRKQISSPTGKLSTNNIGIKETLNPTIRKKANDTNEVLSDKKDDFTIDQLEYAWKEYSLGVKRERKDSLYSTLVKSKMTMSSDYMIHLDIMNTVQAAELDKEKSAILGFLRNKLSNYKIGLKYAIIETEDKIKILDNKGIFDKLAAENSSLNKFRKLFNLDIEF